MVTHYFTLDALCGELHGILSGATITDLFTQQKNELVARVSVNGTEMALVVSVDPAFNYLYIRDAFARAKRNSVSLFPTLEGAVINSVSIIPGDRIIVIRCTGEYPGQRTGNYALVLRLYNTVRSNIFLTDGDGAVLETFKQGEDHVGTAPLSGSAHPAPVVPKGYVQFLESMMAQGAATAFAASKKVLPMFGSTFAREALHRAGIQEDSTADSLNDQQLTVLYDAAIAINQERRTPKPALYFRGETASVFSVITLHHLASAKTESFPDVNRGVRVCVAQAYKTERIDNERDQLLEKLKRIAHTTRKALDAARAQQKDTERAADFEKSGSLLMSNLTMIMRGAKTITVNDIIDGEGDIAITLDPKIGPVQNAERYFEKAKKAKLAVKELEDRVRELTERDTMLSTMLLHLDRCRTIDEVKEFRTTYGKELRAMHIGESTGSKGGQQGGNKSSDDEQFPFRRFTVVGGYEVWVGKNSANNDLLTMKYAKPNDYWFHARGSSGSHTVLRVTDTSHPPPKEAVLAAASIAAYYSKMRNAGNVPVAYCERKYVRKGKGLAEGAVYLDKEKVVLVAPKLPKE